MTALQAGDRVTVLTTPDDPLELCLKRHAVVTEVRPADGQVGSTYMVGHPWESRQRYGPYEQDRLIRGWDTP